MSNLSDKLLHIATIGKTVGLKGDMKLHIKSDFPEQFVKGAKFLISKNRTVEIEEIDLERNLFKIKGVDNPEDAKRYTNEKIYTTYEETRKNIKLEEGQYFYFDIEGCKVYDNGLLLGIVDEVERIGPTDYLSMITDEALVAKQLPKLFLIPYQDHFIVSVDIDKKSIQVSGGLDILENS
ncbi:ribosome maturation factor RimM [Sulfurimonas sp. HSL-1716]|uniref:ribosome maturation factor RimM n=1 Tax=Hydrocurvibacter sulfurireducens TaxID=3131937 RepID=UPI0031F80AD6